MWSWEWYLFFVRHRRWECENVPHKIFLWWLFHFFFLFISTCANFSTSAFLSFDMTILSMALWVCFLFVFNGLISMNYMKSNLFCNAPQTPYIFTCLQTNRIVCDKMVLSKSLEVSMVEQMNYIWYLSFIGFISIGAIFACGMTIFVEMTERNSESAIFNWKTNSEIRRMVCIVWQT